MQAKSMAWSKSAATSRNMERAFGVKLFEAQTGTERFRSRVPPGTAPAAISIPRELEELVIAVLGLDTRPQAKPHFRVLPTESTGGGQLRAREIAPRYTAGQVAQLYDFPDGDGEGRSSRNHRAGRRLPDLRSGLGRHRSIAGECCKR
jgi:kumamolisin